MLEVGRRRRLRRGHRGQQGRGEEPPADEGVDQPREIRRRRDHPAVGHSLGGEAEEFDRQVSGGPSAWR